ncbi:MAG TPA: hypothetical protein V7792_01110 [Candidatus Azoamicus sp. OHIO2]
MTKKNCIIIIIILLFILPVTCFTKNHIGYGKLITYADFQAISQCTTQPEIIIKIGTPHLELNIQDLNIWCYYYIDNAPIMTSRRVIRLLIISFDDTLKITSLDFFF